LEKHIRFEERVLFKELQRVVSEEELEKLVQIPDTEREDLWEDKFWEIKKI
jgi:hemerythrin-like domain-containing protein